MTITSSFNQWYTDNKRELLSEYEDYLSDAMAAQYDSTTEFGLESVVSFEDWVRDRYNQLQDEQEELAAEQQ